MIGTLLNKNIRPITQEDKDFYLALTPDGNGHFRHSFDHDISGKWKITISPFDNNWKIQETIVLPNSTAIDIIPDPTKAQ